MSYLVTTRAMADTPGFTRGCQCAVRRRFNDFVALSGALKVMLGNWVQHSIWLDAHKRRTDVDG